LRATDSTPDFEVTLPGGETIALKVTSSADEAVLRQAAQAFKRKWPAPSLNYNWWIGLGETPSGLLPKLKEVAVAVEQWLAACESAGVTEIEDAGAAPELAKFGVRFARRMEPPEHSHQPELLFSFLSAAQSAPDQVSSLVEAAAVSNAAKLRASAASERHLFVWIDGSTANAELAVALSPPPTAGPTLPGGIDVVWATSVVLLAPAGVAPLWRARSTGTWEAIDPPVNVSRHRDSSAHE
jgi:hypothetical protein